jgi:hypothetical protein
MTVLPSRFTLIHLSLLNKEHFHHAVCFRSACPLKRIKINLPLQAACACHTMSRRQHYIKT